MRGSPTGRNNERACQATPAMRGERCQRKDLAFIRGDLDKNECRDAALNGRDQGKGTRILEKLPERFSVPAGLEACGVQSRENIQVGSACVTDRRGHSELSGSFASGGRK